MIFKYGSAKVTATKSKEGFIITQVVIKVGQHRLNFDDIGHTKRVDRLLGDLEKRAEKIYSKKKGVKRG